MDSREDMVDYLRGLVCEFKGLPGLDGVPITGSWYEFGMDSADLAGITATITEDLGVEIDPEILFEKDTLEDLSEYIFDLTNLGLTER